MILIIEHFCSLWLKIFCKMFLRNGWIPIQWGTKFVDKSVINNSTGAAVRRFLLRYCYFVDRLMHGHEIKYVEKRSDLPQVSENFRIQTYGKMEKIMESEKIIQRKIQILFFNMTATCQHKCPIAFK